MKAWSGVGSVVGAVMTGAGSLPPPDRHRHRPAADPRSQNLRPPIIPAMLVVIWLIVGAMVDEAR